MKELHERVEKALEYYKLGIPIKDADITDKDLAEYILRTREAKWVEKAIDEMIENLDYTKC